MKYLSINYWKSIFLSPDDRYVFSGYIIRPLPDITAYELALIVSITTLPKDKQIHEVNKLNEDCFRHLIRTHINMRTGNIVETQIQQLTK